MMQTYEAPYLEIIIVASEKGFSNSSNMEDVGKDECVEF
jgi:hypothetical protein